MSSLPSSSSPVSPLSFQSSPPNDEHQQQQQRQRDVFLRQLEKELLEEEEEGEGKDRPEKLLLLCADAVASGDLESACELLNRLNQVVSIIGDPMQRLAAYMKEALVARLQSSGVSLCSALKCSGGDAGKKIRDIPRIISESLPPPVQELRSAMLLLFEACPYFKFGFATCNTAIVQALRGAPSIHILDLEITPLATQWIAFIRALVANGTTAPHFSLRITAGGVGAEAAGQRLEAAAAEAGLAFFKFQTLTPGDDELKSCIVHPSEAFAVSFSLSLHHLPGRRRDVLLRSIRRLSPRIVALAEQEADTDEQPLFPRFVEAMNHYASIFDSIDAAIPDRKNPERVRVEQHCLARELVNIIACEGDERFERHQRAIAWAARMRSAGFSPLPVAPAAISIARHLLATYSPKYVLDEYRGIFLRLGWVSRAIVAFSTWQCDHA